MMIECERIFAGGIAPVAVVGFIVAPNQTKNDKLPTYIAWATTKKIRKSKPVANNAQCTLLATFM